MAAETDQRTTMEQFGDEIGLRGHYFQYFSRTNFPNKSILLQERLFKKHIGEDWNNFPEERKDDLLDLLSVDEEVRELYDTDNKVLDIDESFPRLLINTGQKINVDFENELWTWKDEHSGPFSWMSKSQQDLTLADLEPETILKPQPKQPRIDLEDENSQKKAPLQFTHPCNSWSHEIIKDFKKQERNIVLTPSPSLDFDQNPKQECVAEEVNHAFHTDDADDLTPRSNSSKDESVDSSQSIKDANGVAEKKLDKKDRGRKSPSPKKTIMSSGSFKKSPVKKSERKRDEKLIVKADESLVSEAYCNPVMESEWSSFVGQQHTNTVTEAPKGQVMTRDGVSEVACASSPYRGDQVQLIENVEDSPAVPRAEMPVWHEKTVDNDWSAESTPDHKTHLLKGLQSPPEMAQKPRLLEDSIKLEDLHLKESEEVLTVSMDGPDIQLSSQQDTGEKRSSYIPSTGFDFLDNW